MLIRTTFPVFAFAILTSGLGISHANAATASASISVSATVQASCLTAVTPSATGAHAAESYAAPAVSVSCSNSVPYNITFNTGVARRGAMAFRPGSGSRFPLLSLAPRALSGHAADPIIVVVTY